MSEHAVPLVILLTPVVLGAGAVYFAPLALKARTLLISSVALTAAGFIVYFISMHCAVLVQQMKMMAIEQGKDLFSGYNWFGFWAAGGMVGLLLLFLGIGSCLGYGLRRVVKGRGAGS